MPVGDPNRDFWPVFLGLTFVGLDAEGLELVEGEVICVGVPSLVFLFIPEDNFLNAPNIFPFSSVVCFCLLASCCLFESKVSSFA